MKSFKEYLTESTLKSVSSDLGKYVKEHEKDMMKVYKKEIASKLESALKKDFDISSFKEVSGNMPKIASSNNYIDAYWDIALKDGTNIKVQPSKLGESLMYQINGTFGPRSENSIKNLVSAIKKEL